MEFQVLCPGRFLSYPNKNEKGKTYLSEAGCLSIQPANLNTKEDPKLTFQTGVIINEKL